MSPDLVTIGMTCHNAERSIGAAIDSALSQDWPEIEIVIVDDASTDGSADVISARAERDSRIRYVRLPENRGVGAARNAILEAASGEYVVFFDDDDVSVPGRVTAQVGRIEQYEKDTGAALVFCHSARVLEDDAGAEFDQPTMGEDVTPAPNGIEVFVSIFAGTADARLQGACATCSQAARRSTYEALGGFDESFRRAEDTDLIARAALAGAHFPGIGRPLVRQRLSSRDDKSFASERDAMLHLIEKHGRHPAVSDWRAFDLEWCEAHYRIRTRQWPAAFVSMVSIAVRSPIRLVCRVMTARQNVCRSAARLAGHKAD